MASWVWLHRRICSTKINAWSDDVPAEVRCVYRMCAAKQLREAACMIFTGSAFLFAVHTMVLYCIYILQD